MAELKPFYSQALMYALACTEVGIATLVSPAANGDLEDKELLRWRWTGFPIASSICLKAAASTMPRHQARRERAHGKDRYKLVPIGNAWLARGSRPRRQLPPTEREFAEGTDLMRALEAGIRIDVTLVTEDMKVLITPAELRGETLDMGH